VWIKVGHKLPETVKDLMRQFHDSDESLPFWVNVGVKKGNGRRKNYCAQHRTQL
jgi:hypothetical protein